MRRLALAVCLAALALAKGPFAFHDDGAGSLTLSENGRPVYVYNYGMKLKDAAPEDRRRSCYLHPVYAPDGTVVTDDFPADHYHHRGIFWAWPIVRAGGQTCDLWTIRGIRQKFVRWIERKAETGAARLRVENGWYGAERNVVKETVEIVALPGALDRRELRFVLSFEAIDSPVDLAGEPAEQKGYGGFCVRFAPREQTEISTPASREKADSNMTRHRWAQLEASFGGRRAGLRIDSDPQNPGFPNAWILRQYGFLGVNFPGLATYTLHPGRPLALKFAVTIFNPAR